MAVTPTTFKARYTEFSSETDARVQVYIDDAELEMNEGQWGTLYDRGLSALTAHLLAIANRNAVATTGTGTSVGGTVQKKSVGSVAVSFASIPILSSVESFYMSTSYGAEYWRLMKHVGMEVVVVD